MSIFKTLTASALVLALVLGSAGAASAAWMAKDTVVKKHPGHIGKLKGINHVSKGEEVVILGEKGSWYKIKIPGPDGWVGKSAISFKKPGKGWGKGKGKWGNGWGNNGGWGGGSGGSFCINGEKAQFCISGSN